jgi:aminocarboxymuconate-semialdehyde decarboxylase
VISQANPWLDFMEDATAAASLCEELNTELNDVCAASNGRLLGFGVLSLPGASVAHTVGELARICTDLPHIRGVILGTYGLGKGLDDPALDPLWATLEATGLVAFVHPHYGVGAPELMSGYGHILPLALGFPFETTTAITKYVYLIGYLLAFCKHFDDETMSHISTNVGSYRYHVD